jgi:outer membrane biosynthesis protein TonB
VKSRAAIALDTRATTAGLAGTLLVHGSVIALLLVGLPERKPAPLVYAVELVAAPLPTAARRLAPEAVARPTPPAPEAQVAKPEPAARAPAPDAPVKAAAKPAPATPPRSAVQETPTEKAPPTRSEATPLPGETPGTGSDVANIKIPGIEFPYPDYLRNIMNEVLRRWTQPNSRLRAEVAFLILKDGTVTDIRFLKRSGNFTFDLEAQGAIESAGNAKAFGPLPDGWDANVLPVTFVFEPRSGS